MLDTWFSSALWPFSTLGWPDNTIDLKRFYPTSVLSTGFDIIFFWVARMIMMGLKFQGDIPFHKVYIHALIRDAEGQKMSKSKGNVIDPLHVIDDYGTDALRFTLAIMAVQGRDILLSEERIEGYKHFCNKIWNAARFILMNLDDYDGQAVEGGKQEIADEWIVSRLNQTISQVTQGLDSFNFAEASAIVYHFVWHEYCDWYLELVKPRLRQDGAARKTAQYLIVTTFDSILKLLHPFMPFITEELWQKLPESGVRKQRITGVKTIMFASWPESGAINPKAIEDMKLVMEIITAIRNIRSMMNIPPKMCLPVIVVKHSLEETAIVLKSCIEYIKRLGNIETVIFDPEAEKPHASAVAVAGGMEVYIPLEGLID
ncbi:MAG: class I tRNA ligase family protein, partial [Candidatus Desantisbacteria bacterium]